MGDLWFVWRQSPPTESTSGGHLVIKGDGRGGGIGARKRSTFFSSLEEEEEE